MAKTPCSQCRGPGIDSWSGNWIPYAEAKDPLQLRPGAAKKINIKNIFLNIIIWHVWTYLCGTIKRLFFLILLALGRHYAKYSAVHLSSQNLLCGTKLKTSLREILQDMYIACFVKSSIFFPELS